MNEREQQVYRKWLDQVAGLEKVRDKLLLDMLNLYEARGGDSTPKTAFQFLDYLYSSNDKAVREQAFSLLAFYYMTNTDIRTRNELKLAMEAAQG